ncbi:MAG: PQQ-binding-like beta-propeller repeat protein [Verrucomicrobiales bacterium]
MNLHLITAPALVIYLAWLSAGISVAAPEWPQWRGPLGTGAAPGARPPIEWSEENNVRWKTALPGLGHSTPVVAGNQIFLTVAEPFGEKLPPKFSGVPGAHDNLPVSQQHRFAVLSIDRESGKILWDKTVARALPHEGGHDSGSLASASPITDGERVISFFGSQGLHCLDLEGKTLWKVELGKMTSKHGHGEGSSPALHDKTVVVNWDHEGDSFAAAFDTHTGAERWRVKRDESTSWSSPIIVEHAGRAQAIISATTRIRSYDLGSGELIWECGGLSDNVVATPVYSDGVVYCGSSYNTKAMLAIKLDGATGDLTDSGDNIIWSRIRRTPYVPSPLVYGEALFFLGHYQPILTRLVAKTGDEPTGPFRLFGLRNIYASPVAADGRIYLTDLEGSTLVLSAEETPKTLARNQLDDRFAASPVLVGEEVYLRGRSHLYCIREAK